MRVYWNPIAFTGDNWTSTPPPGYDASNLENTAIRVPWRTSNVTNTQGFQLDFAPTPVHCIIIYGIASTAIGAAHVKAWVGQNDSQFVEIPNIQIIQDPYYRFKCLICPYDAGFTDPDYEIFWFELGGPGLFGSYWEIGAAHLFASGLSIGNDNPAYSSRMRHVAPTDNQTLANGAQAAVSLGPEYEVLDLTFDAIRSGGSVQNEPEFVQRALISGHVGITLENQDYEFWPMVYDSFESNSVWQGHNLDKVSYRMKEVVHTL